VIQQGTVRLVNETDEGEELRDILGTGDLLGVGRFLGHDIYRHTARAATDVVLYCLLADDVERLIDTHKEVARYLEASASVRGRGPSDDQKDETRERLRRAWVDETGPAEAVTRRRLLTCSPDGTIQSAAEQMARATCDSVVVTDPQGLALGLLTTDMLRDRVATAQVSPDAPVAAIMGPVPVTAPRRSRTSGYWARLPDQRGLRALARTVPQRYRGSSTPSSSGA
jgi:CBS domain-containing protein